MAINVEANLTVEIARTMIYPTVIRYQGELAGSLANLQAVGIEGDSELLSEIVSCSKALLGAVNQLEKLNGQHADGLLAEAKHACFTVVPAMGEVRKIADTLENLVADDMWPLPTYQEMLFIK